MGRVLGITKVSGVKVSWLFVFLVVLEVLCWTQVTCSVQSCSVSGFANKHNQFQTINIDIAIQISLIVETLRKVVSDVFIPELSYFEKTSAFNSKHIKTTSDTQLLSQGYDQNPRKPSASRLN